jgi:hypothetical protein
VDKHIRPAFLPDESIALRIVEPFDSADHLNAPPGLLRPGLFQPTRAGFKAENP